MLALPEDDSRLVVIVAHLRIAGGREGNDAELAQRQSSPPFEARRFPFCRRSARRLSGFLPLTGVEGLHRSSLSLEPCTVPGLLFERTRP